MDAVHPAKEAELRTACYDGDPDGDEVAEAYSSRDRHAGDFLLPTSRGAMGDRNTKMPEEELVTSLRARLRITLHYTSFLQRFRRERGTAQHWDHQYSTGCTICGHIPIRADSTADVMGKHQQLCKAGGGVDRRHNCFRKGVCSWLVNVCSVPCVDIGRHVPEWVQ